MTQTTVPSTSRPNIEHTLFLINGVAKGCSCEARQHNITKPCSHMKRYNRTPVSCELCGSLTYSKDGVCGKCYGY